jgi:probable rRNA maturation factor
MPASRDIAAPAAVSVADPEPEPGHAHDVLVEDDGWARFGDVAGLIGTVVEALAAHEPKLRRVGVSIVLSNDAAVREMNRTWRGQDKPTNVLSFPFEAPVGMPDAEPYLGDVILALETVEREADDMELPVAHHLQHLVLHGLLHLLGFDHDTDAAAQRMERLETKLLAGLGIADPYAGS